MDGMSPTGKLILLQYDEEPELTPSGLVAVKVEPHEPHWATVIGGSNDEYGKGDRVLVRHICGVKVPGSDLRIVDPDDVVGFVQ